MKKTNRLSLEQVGAMSAAFGFDFIVRSGHMGSLKPESIGSTDHKSGPIGFQTSLNNKTIFATDYDLQVDDLSDASLLHEIVHLIVQPPWTKTFNDIRDEGFLLLPFELALARQLFKKKSPALAGVKRYQHDTGIGGARDITVGDFGAWWKTSWFSHSLHCMKRWGVIKEHGVVFKPWPWNEIITEKKWNKEFKNYEAILDKET